MSTELVFLNISNLCYTKKYTLVTQITLNHTYCNVCPYCISYVHSFIILIFYYSNDNQQNGKMLGMGNMYKKFGIETKNGSSEKHHYHHTWKLKAVCSSINNDLHLSDCMPVIFLIIIYDTTICSKLQSFLHISEFPINYECPSKNFIHSILNT